jgi:hypothetical protein
VSIHASVAFTKSSMHEPDIYIIWHHR